MGLTPDGIFPVKWPRKDSLAFEDKTWFAINSLPKSYISHMGRA